MNKSIHTTTSILKGKNATEVDVNQPWELDNQAWWDWYVTLAETETKFATKTKIAQNFKNCRILSSNELKKELNTTYQLKRSEKNFFSENGFIKIKKLFSESAIFTLNNEISKIITKKFDEKDIKDTMFLSLDMTWLDNELIKQFVLSPKIAKIIAELLNVVSIRLYHDNILIKRSGCGRTPWHHDIHHFPLETKDIITVWIPAQTIPESMGPLTFAKPIDAYKLVKNIDFNKFDDSYDREISKIFRSKKIQIESSSFDIGEVSFHHNLCFHSAGSNNTLSDRIVLANTYYADGAKLVKNPTMVSGDWKKFIPDTKPGEVAASSLNPICWPKKSLK